MRALRARVEDGRYVIDEKPQEPEGTVLSLHVTEADEDELSAEELAAACAEADEDEREGRMTPVAQFFAELEKQ
jgi:hypothetical protein